jgi:hypothetical protein
MGQALQSQNAKNQRSRTMYLEILLQELRQHGAPAEHADTANCPLRTLLHHDRDQVVAPAVKDAMAAMIGDNYWCLETLFFEHSVKHME